jgi:hypothetical protein
MKMKHLNSFEEYKVYYSHREAATDHDYGFYCDTEKYNIRDVIPLHGGSKKKEIENIEVDFNDDNKDKTEGYSSIVVLKNPFIYCIHMVCCFSFIIGNCLHLFAQCTMNHIGVFTEYFQVRVI